MRFLRPFINLLLGARAVPVPTANAAKVYSFALAASALTYLLSGCAGGGAGPSAAAKSGSLSISGQITPGTAGQNVTVSLAGQMSTTAQTDSSGHYSFPNLQSGSYVVIPSRPGYVFKPELQDVTIANASQNNVGFSGVTGHTVEVSWQPSTSQVLGYNVYRATTNGGPYSKINTGLVITETYIDENVTAGNTYYYVSTAVNSSGVESPFSAQVSAEIP
jgi:Carboxypeptidase regulatory-like domain